MSVVLEFRKVCESIFLNFEIVKGQKDAIYIKKMYVVSFKYFEMY